VVLALLLSEILREAPKVLNDDPCGLMILRNCLKLATRVVIVGRSESLVPSVSCSSRSLRSSAVAQVLCTLLAITRKSSWTWLPFISGMSSVAMRSVTHIHSLSHLSMLVLHGLGDCRMSYFPLSSLLCVGSDGARWALSLISRACAVLSFWISGIKDVEIVEAMSVQISLSALSFWFHFLYTHSHSLRHIRCS
jgi:hypothetical protein